MPNHIDGPLLGGIGTLLLGLSSLAGLLGIGVWLRRLLPVFRSKIELANETDAARRELEQAKLLVEAARTQATIAHATAEEWRLNHGALANRLKDLEDGRDMVARKLTALVGYTQLVVAHCGYLEGKLGEAGIKIERSMPDVPEILATELA